jgi:hypothetical protein
MGFADGNFLGPLFAKKRGQPAETQAGEQQGQKGRDCKPLTHFFFGFVHLVQSLGQKLLIKQDAAAAGP